MAIPAKDSGLGAVLIDGRPLLPDWERRYRTWGTLLANVVGERRLGLSCDDS